MRIEDLDSPRVKSWAVAQAAEDLRWLGLDWDEGPDIGGSHEPYRQTERLDHYRVALQTLKSTERVYPCTCTRRDIELAASAPHAEHEGPVYPRTCAQRRVADAEQIAQPFSWRLRCTPGESSFFDRFAGRQSCLLERELGDFAIAKAGDMPAYQLAVVCDDHEMEVTEVVRGDDLIPSTFRQLELYRFFTWQPPEFYHVPLVVGEDGRRLAKRHGDTRLSTFRDAGIAPETLVGWLAWTAGLLPEPEPVQAGELLDQFDWNRVPTGPVVADHRLLDRLR